MLPKIKKRNLSAQLVEAMVALIENGTWPLGEKLPNEIDLAASFSVSRNIMREAMKILENNGVLESKAGNGTYVAQAAQANICSMRFFSELQNNQSVSMILESRLIIEPNLAYFACQRCTEEEIDELEKLCDSTSLESEEGIKGCHFAFHEKLAQLSGNDILSNLLSVLLAQLEEGTYASFNQYVSKEVVDESDRDYRLVIEALRKRDAESVRDILHNHLAKRIQFILSAYKCDEE